MTDSSEQLPESGDEVQEFLDRIRAAPDNPTLAELAATAMRELAPNQMHDLYQRVATVPEAEKAGFFLSKSPLRVLFSRREVPQFDNHRLTPNVRLYVARGVPKAEKVLLVIFANRNGEMFMTVPRILMRLPAGGFDVLRLRATLGQDYPHGVPGFGDTFPEVCRTVKTFLPGYAGAVTMGSSLGAYTALRAAVMLKLPMGVSLAGRFSAVKWWGDKPARPAFDPLCPCVNTPATRLRAYLAGDHRRDAYHADMLLAMRPDAEVLRSSIGNDHNVLTHLVADGRFDALLKEMRTLAMGAAVPA